jgi:glycosyltransferase involved in cell wall biosynthesis
MRNEPLVSIIIPTYNSGKTLAKCLESIENQSYADIEVIVVDKYSADGTKEITSEYRAKIIESDAKLSKARNIGIKEAKGEFVFSVDSDMELSEEIIKDCVTTLQLDETIGGVIIPERSVGDSFWVRVRDWERSFYAGTEVESARFFRKELVEKVGGYDEAVLFFEDSTLPQKIEKIGYNVKVHISSEIFHHEDDFYLFNWLKKKYYYGKTAQIYRHKYEEYGKRQMSVLYRFGVFFKNKRFYSKPLLAIGVLVLKSLEFCSAGLGYLAGVNKKNA